MKSVKDMTIEEYLKLFKSFFAYSKTLIKLLELELEKEKRNEEISN